jgi:hypothetical protein
LAGIQDLLACQGFLEFCSTCANLSKNNWIILGFDDFENLASKILPEVVNDTCNCRDKSVKGVKTKSDGYERTLCNFRHFENITRSLHECPSSRQ